MTDYPILVEQYKGKQSLRVVCGRCGAQRQITDDEINQEATFTCGACGEWTAVFMYAEADKCPNCGSLGFYEDVLDRCCSRACQLQAEYARQLADREAS